MQGCTPSKPKVGSRSGCAPASPVSSCPGWRRSLRGSSTWWDQRGSSWPLLYSWQKLRWETITEVKERFGVYQHEHFWRLFCLQVKVWFQNRRIKWRKQSLEQQQAKLAKLGLAAPPKSPGSQGHGDEGAEDEEFSDSDVDIEVSDDSTDH